MRWSLLSGIGMPDSGTEPIHQEHVMCSRFRGSCPSDVKSAVHPESGISIPLSKDTAALCAPRETQKNPDAGSIPEYRPWSPPLSIRQSHPRGKTALVHEVLPPSQIPTRKPGAKKSASTEPNCPYPKAHGLPSHPSFLPVPQQKRLTIYFAPIILKWKSNVSEAYHWGYREEALVGTSSV